MNDVNEYTARFSLTFNREFYDLLNQLADNEGIILDLWIKKLIMKSVLDGHYAKDNPEYNEIEKNAFQKYDSKSLIMGKKKKRKNA